MPSFPQVRFRLNSKISARLQNLYKEWKFPSYRFGVREIFEPKLQCSARESAPACYLLPLPTLDLLAP
jgi:hypothetical protein